MNKEIRQAFSDLNHEMTLTAHKQNIRSLNINASSSGRIKAFHTSQRYNHFGGFLDAVRLAIQESGYSNVSRYNLLIILRFLEEVGDSELQGKLQEIIDALGDSSSPIDVEHTLAEFRFCGGSYSIGFWYEHLVEACKILSETFGNRFDKVLEYRGIRNRTFFSKKPDDLVKPTLIPETDIYAEINLGKDAIMELVRGLAEFFEVEQPQKTD